MSLPFPKAVIFDWDNTLIDSWITIHHALSVTFKEMGRTPWTLEEAKGRVRASARDSFPVIFGADSDIATKIFYNTYEANHLDVLTPLPYAKELLDSLKKANVYLAIVSNKQGVILRKEVEHLGWGSYFNQVIGANDAAQDKPNPMGVALALEGSGLHPDQSVWFVGDTDIDLQCAHNAKCYPVLVRPTAPVQGEFDNIEPAQYFTSCLDIMNSLS
ncbi:HAD family hydrolase [Kiloniella antarctica]|uniref:phosphoglycolate phosphatase n=1 Tax=Kiloniella antarctica TaxID=1550907 RepID=A0ABW5BPI0_9PROT